MPIPGTRRRKHLEDNVKAVDVTLTKADLARIDRIMPLGSIAGDRYQASGMKAVNR